MSIKEYNKRMIKLLRNRSKDVALEVSILKAHQTIEAETKTFINLSHADIERFKMAAS